MVLLIVLVSSGSGSVGVNNSVMVCKACRLLSERGGRGEAGCGLMRACRMSWRVACMVSRLEDWGMATLVGNQEMVSQMHW